MRSASLVARVSLLLLLALPLSAASPELKATPEPEAALEARVRRILTEVPLIDGHNDLPWALREKVGNRLETIDLRQDHSQGEKALQTDLPRLKQGGVGAQFWSVYVPVELEKDAAVTAVFEQIDVVHRLCERYPESLELALTAADVERIHHSGKVASLIGIEGGHSIHDSLAVLRQAFRAGARYMTLTHWKNTAWADSATDAPQHDGLTEFGREVVREMNRLGMQVDLSHVSPATMNEALETAVAPVIFSHSSTSALTKHPRNVPNEVLKRLSANGGVVMVTFVPSFISEDVRRWEGEEEATKARLANQMIGRPQKEIDEAVEAWRKQSPRPAATLAQVADHIDHVRAVAGIDHIGIGSDLDGIGIPPVGLEDVSKFPALLIELARRGYSDDDLAKIAGRNLLRVMRQVETVAARLQKERRSSDARIEDVDRSGS